MRKKNNIVMLATAAVAVIASLMAAQLPAQTANIVTLETFDGSSSVSGELIEVDDRSYRIQTIVGILDVAIQTVDCTGEACPVLIPEYVVGEDVTLTFKDGSASVTGEVVLSTDAEVTILSDLIGPVAFNLSKVTCSGPNCHLARPKQSAASILQSLLNGTQN